RSRKEDVELVVRLRVVRLEGDGLLHLRDCVRVVALFRKEAPHVEVSADVRRVELEHATKATGRRVEVSLLELDEAEARERFDVVRVGGELTLEVRPRLIEHAL